MRAPGVPVKLGGGSREVLEIEPHRTQYEFAFLQKKRVPVKRIRCGEACERGAAENQREKDCDLKVETKRSPVPLVETTARS